MRSTRKLARIVDSLGLLVLLASLSGCSVILAASKPDQKDLNVLIAGTPRADVLKEFGEPKQTGMREGNRVDIFKYKEGERSTQRFGRAALHGGLDLLTFGIWEVVGTPAEIMTIQPDLTVEVTYDEQDQVVTTGPPGIRWVKADSTPEDFQRDNYECRQASTASAPLVAAGPGPMSPLPFEQGAEKQAKTLYRDCMRARGYELTRRLPNH